MAKYGTSAWLQPTILIEKYKIWHAYSTPIFPVSVVVSNHADAQLITLIKHLRNW